MNPKCRIVALSATPIYDNPYELALTMNLLRPRVPFPLSKDEFYSFFLGEYNDDDDDCMRVRKGPNYIKDTSCVINKNLNRPYIKRTGKSYRSNRNHYLELDGEIA